MKRLTSHKKHRSLTATLLLASAPAFAQSAPGVGLMNWAVPTVAALTVISAIIGVAAIAFGNELGKRVLMGTAGGLVAILLMKAYPSLVTLASS